VSPAPSKVPHQSSCATWRWYSSRVTSRRYTTATAIGVDAEAHAIVLSPGTARVTKLVIHPPGIEGKRAFCTGFDEIREPFPYLVRDHHIVDEVDLLVAVPKSAVEVVRSGTWATARYARKLRKLVIRLNPDGSVSLG
jgi:hypothetical protein